MFSSLLPYCTVTSGLLSCFPSLTVLSTRIPYPKIYQISSPNFVAIVWIPFSDQAEAWSWTLSSALVAGNLNTNTNPQTRSPSRTERGTLLAATSQLHSTFPWWQNDYFPIPQQSYNLLLTAHSPLGRCLTFVSGQRKSHPWVLPIPFATPSAIHKRRYWVCSHFVALSTPSPNICPNMVIR